LRRFGGANWKELTNKLRRRNWWPQWADSQAGRNVPGGDDFYLEQHKLLEPLYQLDKDGKLSGEVKTACKANHFSKDS